MRLNETRNVLWYESCKFLCKLNSSVCNNKHFWKVILANVNVIHGVNQDNI